MRKNIYRFIRAAIVGYLFLGIACSTKAQVVITTNVVPPISPFLNQTITDMSYRVLVNVKNNDPQRAIDIRIRGRIMRELPGPFTITLKQDYQSKPIHRNPSELKALTSIEIKEAFGNLDEYNLEFQGITLD